MEQSTEQKTLEGPVTLEITGGQGEITTRVAARCYYKNKSYYLLFQEPIGEDDRKEAILFSSRLKISPEQVTLRRSLPGDGDGSSKPVMEMVYRKGTEGGPGCFVDYPTPYGVLRLEIRTDKLVIREKEGELLVNIRYRLLQEEKEVSEDGLVIRIAR